MLLVVVRMFNRRRLENVFVPIFSRTIGIAGEETDTEIKVNKQIDRPVNSDVTQKYCLIYPKRQRNKATAERTEKQRHEKNNTHALYSQIDNDNCKVIECVSARQPAYCDMDDTFPFVKRPSFRSAHPKQFHSMSIYLKKNHCFLPSA